MSHLVSKLSGLPKGINDRLMTLRLLLSGKRHATIVSAYASTIINPDEAKDKFYDDLDSVISAAPRTDKFILLGDFNARVGTDHQTWEGMIRSEGVGRCNSNGLLLLRKCAEHELLITNTIFRLQTRRKTSWMHPRSKHWYLIDYVIVRRKDRQEVRVIKTMCGADCWSKACQQTQSAQSAYTTTTRQESAKDIGCLQAETRQQEASIRQWYMQPFGCTGTQFRRCRWELDSLQRHRPLFSNWFPRTSISQMMRMTKTSRDKKHQKHLSNTSSVSSTNFSEQFRKLINRYKRIGYSLDIMRQTACLVVNPIIVDGYASLFNCTTALRASDSMMASS